ncbi:MAG: PIG-L family deacetylase [Candidatus Hodarchaeales archaeon]|jgi:bacillithiol biosynthesis deacetylase BshB1
MVSLLHYSGKLDILAVAAHPDDTEIGCGGILARLSREGKRVGVADLSDGEPTPYTTSRDERLEEATNSAKILGLKVREILDLPNRKLMDNFDARIALAKCIRIYQPKILLSQFGHTPGYGSPDHYQAQLITESAMFYARLTKWEEYFGDLKTHRILKLFYYVTMREVPIPEFILPRFVVDVSEDFSKKINAINAYASQFRHEPSSKGVVSWLEAMGKYYGKLIDKEYGELLLSPKNIELSLDTFL